jgi:hypothetical protein
LGAERLVWTELQAQALIFEFKKAIYFFDKLQTFSSGPVHSRPARTVPANVLVSYLASKRDYTGPKSCTVLNIVR